METSAKRIGAELEGKLAKLIIRQAFQDHYPNQKPCSCLFLGTEMFLSAIFDMVVNRGVIGNDLLNCLARYFKEQWVFAIIHFNVIVICIVIMRWSLFMYHDHVEFLITFLMRRINAFFVEVYFKVNRDLTVREVGEVGGSSIDCKSS